MQLGELQHQLQRFERRGVAVVALSVDPPADSLAMIERLGLRLLVASDQNQRVIRQFGVQNPDTLELALHAVYIVDEQARVFYRKVGRRRPTSNELIDAIDAHRGVYPQSDEVAPRRGPMNVAYPRNDFQALLEVSAVDAVPANIDRQSLAEVMSLLESGRGDDAVFAFRRLIDASPAADRAALYDTAAWMTQARLFADRPEALAAGRDLRRRLDRIRRLEGELEAARDEGRKDALLHELASARGGLAKARAGIDRHAREWNLRYAKTMLRSYRELARAGSEAGAE